MADHPRPGVDYKRSVGELQSWFGAGDDCLDYLEWLRWPDGFVCPECAGGGWLTADERYKCARGSVRTSVTAGTLFDRHRHRSPLTVWSNACWMFASRKDGAATRALGDEASAVARDRVVCLSNVALAAFGARASRTRAALWCGRGRRWAIHLTGLVLDRARDKITGIMAEQPLDDVEVDAGAHLVGRCGACQPLRGRFLEESLFRRADLLRSVDPGRRG